MSRQIAIPYAVRDGVLVHVSQVEGGFRHDCMCIVCGTALVARKGAKVTHHFAHPSNANCSGETVLHVLSKQFLVARIRQAIETKSELPVSWQCHQCHDQHSGNLIKKAAHVAMEAAFDGCRPDIVLLDGQDSPVAIIEVVVTHPPEENVLAFCRTRGVVLVTWKIKSAADLEALRTETKLQPTEVGLCTRPKCKRCKRPLYQKQLKIADGECWKCHRPMKIGVLSTEGIGASLDLLTEEERRLAAQNGLILKRQYSRTQRRSYIASTCGACNAFSGEFFRHEYVYEEGPVLQLGMLCYVCDLQEDSMDSDEPA
jgi:ssDNA-binding Zn-finger/Zn-ribbon topoisomerase 1